MDIQLPKDTEQKLIHSVSATWPRTSARRSASSGVASPQVLPGGDRPQRLQSAIADAQGYFQERTLDLENVCFAQEFGYWNKKTGKATSRKPDMRR